MNSTSPKEVNSDSGPFAIADCHCSCSKLKPMILVCRKMPSAALVRLDPATEITGKHLPRVFTLEADREKTVPVLAHRIFIEFLELLRGDPTARNLLRDGQKFSRWQAVNCEHICILPHGY